MHLLNARTILTFVVTLSIILFSQISLPTKGQAAIEAPSPDIEEPAPAIDPITPADEMLKQTIGIGTLPAPPPRAEKAEFFYKFRKELSIRGGGFANRDISGAAFGILYLFPTYHLKSLEAGADLLSNSTGALHLTKRFEFSRTRFRPFTKLGLGIRIVPEEELVSFLKISNFQLRGGGGFEQSVTSSQSVRVDLEALVSTDTLQAMATLGYVWAW